MKKPDIRKTCFLSPVVTQNLDSFSLNHIDHLKRCITDLYKEKLITEKRCKILLEKLNNKMSPLGVVSINTLLFPPKIKWMSDK